MMIYLEPTGGLCNRIMAADSMLQLCSRHKRDLTILWNVNQDLSVPFEALFSHPETEGIKVRIINTTPVKLRWRKKYLKAMKLNNVISGHWLRTINSQHRIPGTSRDVNEVDEAFSRQIMPALEPLLTMKKTSALISSCYRLVPPDNAYSLWRPIDALQSRIDERAQSFDRTAGFHIRRTDHKDACTYSTLDKFRSEMDRLIEKYPNQTFFISTDDNTARDELISQYGERILHNNFTEYNRSSRQAIEDAVVDLYCLSRTQAIYGSYLSTFSQVAADIGNIELTPVR